MNPPSPDIDWDLCTAEGSQIDQLRRWSALTLHQKLEALDEMCTHARRTLESRRRRGLPYIDPHTGELIDPADDGGCPLDRPSTDDPL